MEYIGTFEINSIDFSQIDSPLKRGSYKTDLSLDAYLKEIDKILVMLGFSITEVLALSESNRIRAEEYFEEGKSINEYLESELGLTY